MNVTVGDVVLPGDIVGGIPSDSGKSNYVIGPGLRLHLNQVLVSKCGILRKKKPSTYYVDCFHQKRYTPARGETVVGIVTSKSGDIFKVDIGSSEQASLNYLAFENSTKKNRPNVQVGDILFAKLVTASRDMEPEIVCVDSYGKKGRLGTLPPGGFLFTCTLNLIRKILPQKSYLMQMLKKESRMPFEIVIGMNGRIWVKCSSVIKTIGMCNTILAAEYCNQKDMRYLSALTGK